jgi:excisionase family DNA binding protein
MENDREDSYLTVAEVAEMLKLNQQTVRNWIDQGSLPAVRVGRRVRIKRSDLQQLLDEGYQPRAAPVRSASRAAPGPSAEDFWGGEPVGFVDTDANAEPSDPGTNAEPSDLSTNAERRAAGASGEQPAAGTTTERSGAGGKAESPDWSPSSIADGGL